MPLRDHFRSPLDDVHSWDELHGMWPAMIVQKLIDVLPEPYFAAPGVHLETLYEVYTRTYRGRVPEAKGFDVAKGNGSVPTYEPPAPALTLEPRLPDHDVYEVRIYDSRRNRHLVAAVEIVSRSNKDRHENRAIFVARAAALLKNNVCLSIIDVVNTFDFNLYAELITFLHGVDPALGAEPPPVYAATLRLRHEDRRRMMDNWYYRLEMGRPLPTLPIWLAENWAISLELESSYETSCRTLRVS